MIKAFKEFWRSYFDLCTESARWMKKHWLGYLIVCLLIFVIELASFGLIGEWFEEFKEWKEKRKEEKENNIENHF